MNCKVCGSNGWINSVQMNKPDRYEKWMGITNVKRRWRRCLGCGLWHQLRNYPLEKIEAIYRDGYRNPAFRGESISEAFDRVMSIKNSENEIRIDWLLNTIDTPGTLLDIGSGLGVFPHVMTGFTDVYCTEINMDSFKFINELGIPCSEDIPDMKFDVISMIHLLEHIEEPIEFLKDVSKHLKPNGKLFLEVPDAIEFEQLFPTNDEFNSCHTHFYDIPSLVKTLDRSVYNVIDVHREHYKERNLYRIMAVCEKGE